MKFLIAVTCFAAFVALTEAKWCSTSEDCKSSKPACCMTVANLKVVVPKKGICMPYSRKGRFCNDDPKRIDVTDKSGNVISSKEFYERWCPCENNMECKPWRKGWNKCEMREGTTSIVTKDPEVVTGVTGEPEITIRTVDDRVTGETRITDEIIETRTPDEIIETRTPDEIIETTRGEIIVEPETTERDYETREPETESPTSDESYTTDWDEVPRGPGGEPPRDDDCEDWELPC